MNLIQQLAKYQNAPVETLQAAKNGAFPTISPWVAGAILEDRIDDEKNMQLAEGAAQGPQPTVDEQQNQELTGIMQAMGAQGAGQAQAAPQGAPVMAAEGGLMQARVNPGMFDYCGGGIIAFSGEERSDVPAAEDDAVYDPVTGALISGGETRRGENQTVREALGLGNVENRRALEKLEEDQRKANAPKKARDPQEAEILRLAAEVARGGAGKGEIQDRAEFDRRRGVNASGAPGGGAKAPAGAPAKPTGGLMDLLTGSAEWADLDAARKKQFEAPKLGQTAGELAAERAAHLKAQGITEMPWETAAKQTAELRRMMKSDDEERAARLEADKGRPTFHRLVANMGAGSFGQSSAPSLRAQVKHEDDVAAETQRIKELRYNQNLKLNDIEAKAKELQYNEAIGDVAAAQKNRKEIAELQRDFEKNRVTIAKGQADLRERAGGEDLRAATQLKTAGMRQGASGALTPKQIADIRDKANDNINNKIKAGGVPLQMAMKKDPNMYARMVEDETNRLLAQLQGGTMPAPSAAGAGGKSPAGWGKAQVVK